MKMWLLQYGYQKVTLESIKIQINYNSEIKPVELSQKSVPPVKAYGKSQSTGTSKSGRPYLRLWSYDWRDDFYISLSNTNVNIIGKHWLNNYIITWWPIWSPGGGRAAPTLLPP